jgi:hypothetical protein
MNCKGFNGMCERCVVSPCLGVCVECMICVCNVWMVLVVFCPVLVPGHQSFVGDPIITDWVQKTEFTSALLPMTPQLGAGPHN